MGCIAFRQRMLSLSTLMRSTSMMTKWMSQILLRMSNQSTTRHSICHISWTATLNQDPIVTIIIAPYPSSSKLKAKVRATKTSAVSTLKGNTIRLSQTSTCNPTLCKEMHKKTRVSTKSSSRHSKSSQMRALSMEAINRPTVDFSVEGPWEGCRVHLGEAWMSLVFKTRE